MSVRPEVRPGSHPPARGVAVIGARRRWAVVAAAPVVVVLALWGLSRVGTAIALSAPGELPWTAGQRHLVTDPGPSDFTQTALATGTLVEVLPGRDPACLAVGSAVGQRLDVVWPHGYRLSPRSEVLRPDGSVAARLGAEVSLTGGMWGGGAVPGDTCPAGDQHFAGAP